MKKKTAKKKVAKKTAKKTAKQATKKLSLEELLPEVYRFALAYTHARTKEQLANEERKEAGKALTGLLRSAGIKSAGIDDIRVTIKDNGSRSSLSREKLIKAGVSAKTIQACTVKSKPSYGALVTELNRPLDHNQLVYQDV